MVKFLSYLLLVSYILAHWPSQATDKQEESRSPTSSPKIHVDESLGLTYSAYVLTRRTDEGPSSSQAQASSPQAHEGKRKKARSLKTIKDHHEFLKKAITEKATKRLFISSCNISRRYLIEEFIPSVTESKTPKLEIRVYTTNKGCKKFEKVMNQLKEALITRMPQMGGSREKDPLEDTDRKEKDRKKLEDIARRYHRTVKVTELTLVVYSTINFKSNFVLIDDNVFVNTSFPWLSVSKLLLPSHIDDIHFGPIDKGKVAKERGSEIIKTLEEVMKQEKPLKKDYSTYLGEILGHDLNIASVSSSVE